MVVSSPRNPAPARDYPNINALHGLRYFFDSTPIMTVGGIQQPSALLKLNTPVVIGTVPRRSFVIGGTVHVKTATTGAATLDIGTKANPTRFLQAMPLNAVIREDDLPAELGYIGDVDTPIYAPLRGSTDLSNGVFSYLMYYYSKGD
ncbi:MAG: hypothetical protein EHM13_11615 [Acidobacteria bacterium]|nr:MAG: hypothetical protein EHM13_11615 [Acidobacteriota bacterium]